MLLRTPPKMPCVVERSIKGLDAGGSVPRLCGASDYSALLVFPALDAREIEHLRSLLSEAAHPYG